MIYNACAILQDIYPMHLGQEHIYCYNSGTSYLSSMLAYSKPIRIITVLTVVDAVMLAAGELCLLQATFTHNQILTGNVFNILEFV